MNNETDTGSEQGLAQEGLVAVIVFAIVFFFVLILTLVTLRSTIKIVHQAEVMVIERFGRYHTTLSPGLNFIIPYVDVPRSVNWRWEEVSKGRLVTRSFSSPRIDLREQVIDFGKQNVITKDTVQIRINALVYYQIVDPRLAVLNIQNLPDAIELLTQSTLRNIIASLTLDDAFSSRERINDDLLKAIVRDAERWGVTITRVEVQHIIPPADIKTTMEAQIIAERNRRSMVLKVRTAQLDFPPQGAGLPLATPPHLTACQHRPPRSRRPMATARARSCAARAMRPRRFSTQRAFARAWSTEPRCVTWPSGSRRPRCLFAAHRLCPES